MSLSPQNTCIRGVSGSYFNVSDFLTWTSGKAIIYLSQIVATTRESSENGKWEMNFDTCEIFLT